PGCDEGVFPTFSWCGGLDRLFVFAHWVLFQSEIISESIACNAHRLSSDRSCGGSLVLIVMLHQERFDESVEISVEYALYVAGFVLGPEIFHHLIRLKDI